MFRALRNLIQRISRQKPDERLDDSSYTAVTAPLTDKQIKEIYQPASHFEPTQLTASAGLSIGKQREHNEDSLFKFSASLAAESGHIPFGIYIIADGLGGHLQGEVASELAVRTMADFLIQQYFIPFLQSYPHTLDKSMQEMMEEGVTRAHHIVRNRTPDGRTTLTAALVIGQRVTIAHVGDSRVYAVFMDGRMQLLTRDHSLAKRLEELGQITPEEAETHPHRNDLYRALGLGEDIEPDVFTLSAPLPDYLLLCSDGLWDVVPESDIYRIVTESHDLQLACQKLVTAANASGGPDNISSVLVRMPG